MVLGSGDTCNSPVQPEQTGFVIDWSTLTIEFESQLDGDAVEPLDEDKLFEAMGFNEADEKAAEKDTEDPAIPVEPMGIHEGLREAAIPVDDVDPAEPVMDWDRDFPDMSVGRYNLSING
jgi:hypothetical protein